MTIWVVRNTSGEFLPFMGTSHQEVGRKLLPTRYDAFRLQVSSSYREVFDRAVRSALDREGWEIVRVNRRATRAGQHQCQDAREFCGASQQSAI